MQTIALIYPFYLKTGDGICFLKDHTIIYNGDLILSEEAFSRIHIVDKVFENKTNPDNSMTYSFPK